MSISVDGLVREGFVKTSTSTPVSEYYKKVVNDAAGNMFSIYAVNRIGSISFHAKINTSIGTAMIGLEKQNDLNDVFMFYLKTWEFHGCHYEKKFDE